MKKSSKQKISINDGCGVVPQVATLVEKAKGSCTEMRPLAFGFLPGPLDVICQRGKSAYVHNKPFRELLEGYLDRYSNATSRLEKSSVVSDVVDAVRDNSPNGGFVRKVDGIYYEVGDAIAREKCGGCFREMLHTKYRSSAKAKRRKRQQEKKTEGGAGAGGAGQRKTSSKQQKDDTTPPLVLDRIPPTSNMRRDSTISTVSIETAAELVVPERIASIAAPGSSSLTRSTSTGTNSTTSKEPQPHEEEQQQQHEVSPPAKKKRRLLVVEESSSLEATNHDDDNNGNYYLKNSNSGLGNILMEISSRREELSSSSMILEPRPILREMTPFSSRPSIRFTPEEQQEVVVPPSSPSCSTSLKLSSFPESTTSASSASSSSSSILTAASDCFHHHLTAATKAAAATSLPPPDRVLSRDFSIQSTFSEFNGGGCVDEFDLQIAKIFDVENEKQEHFLI